MCMGDRMEIKGKVHCFFEQSGTFKNEFIKLGILAEDYDIQNNFNQTDHIIDLFSEIETEYRQQATGNRQLYLIQSILVKTLLLLFSLVYILRRYSSFVFAWQKMTYRKNRKHGR